MRPPATPSFSSIPFPRSWPREAQVSLGLLCAVFILSCGSTNSAKSDPIAPAVVRSAVVPHASIQRIEHDPLSALPLVQLNGSAVRVPLTMARLHSHQISPQQAWDSGELNVGDLLYLLTDTLDVWGGFTWGKDPDLRRSLVALLVQHGGASLQSGLEKPESLSPRVRLWLADYYGSIKNERALALAEGILSEIREPVKGENPLVFQAVERIAWFYGDARQYEKAAQTWLRIESLHRDAGWWVPDSLVEAARFYKSAGQSDKANALYARVSNYDYGWSTGMALYDQATTLINEGKHSEARLLLQRRVKGRDANQIRVGLLSLLGTSYYSTGEFEKARQYNQEAVADYANLINPHQGEGLQALVASSQERLKWTQRWQNAPFFGTPTELRFEANAPQSALQQLLIYSFADVPFTVVSDDPTILVKQTDRGKQEAFAFVKGIDVNYQASKAALPLQKPFTSSLTIRSPKFPKFLLRVPVYVTVAKPVMVTNPVAVMPEPKK